MRIGFLGYGNMASAIATGIVKSKVVDPKDIYASARDYEKLEKNTAKLGINPTRSSNELVEKSDLIVIGVKPEQVKDVAGYIKNDLEEKIIVSIAAGVFYDEYEEVLKNGAHHISTIPNIPISTGKGVMICENKHSLSEEQLEEFKNIFGQIALLEFVDTKKVPIAGTIAGCGPAFASMFIEALGDAGVKYGLTREQSYNLAAKMVEGTGGLYLESKKHPAEIKDSVCSPGGTTIRGVCELERAGFSGAVISAIDVIEG